ncbi:flocculation protein FLO11-like [Patiria miniata]|uniref:Uncharacterized protein n=1 Tax=Patiria miniata TaxID=46514 RepID=A0A914BKK1_PATMI|nr:flocculation protein FLO11-like [Patiria miniata]XP_038076451.1 flocculation protein FLO11-like [Patiria miniata]
MSKRRREKHDINLTRAEPGLAKKMKISSRLRKPKAEPRTDSHTVSSAYISPECRSKMQSGRHRHNNSLSESETEIIWDGNSPTAHLQRRIGRHGRSKAGDISEIVQCVNNQAGSTDNSSADMPLLGLWMTRSPNHPAVDLGVVRKTLAHSEQESSKPKSTHRKTTGRLSLLQAELEKIANAINNSVSMDVTGVQNEEQNISETDGNQKQLCMVQQLQHQETVCGDKQLPEEVLVTGQVVGVKTVTKKDQQVSRCQASTRPLVTGKTSTGRLPTSQPKTGHFGRGQSDSSRRVRSQPSTGHSVTGQSNGSRLVAGQSTSQTGQSATGQPKSSCSIAGQSNSGPLAAYQSISDKSKSSLLATGHRNAQPNSGHSVTGKSFVGCLAIGQSSTGQSSTSQSTIGQSVNSKTNAAHLVTSKSATYKSPTPSINGQLVNIKSNAAHLVSGQSSIGQLSTSQSTIGRSVQSKPNAGPLATVHSSTVQSSTSQSTTGQSVNQLNSGRLGTGQSNIGQSSTSQSFTGHSVRTKSNAGHAVTCQASFGPSSTSQSTNGQSVHGKSTSGRLVTGHSSTGQMSTPHPNAGRSVSSKSSFGHSIGLCSTGQTTTSQPTRTKAVTSQSTSGRLVSVQSINGQLSTTQSTNGQSVTGRSNVGHSVAGQPNTGHLSNSHSHTSQSNMGHSTAGQSKVGQSFVFKSKTGQSVPSQSVVSHCAINNQSNISHTTKNHISHHQSDSSTSTNHQSALSKTITNQASTDNDSLWDDCEDLDDELLLAQLSQAEAMETCHAATKQKSPNGSVQTNLPVASSNFQKDTSNQAKAASVARPVIDLSSNCAPKGANFSSLVDHQTSKESLGTNVPVTSSIQTNKFNFKREAGNQNKPVTNVPRPVTNTIGLSSNCVSVKANIGHPMDHQSSNESFQPNKPVTSSIPTNKFNFQRGTSNQNKQVTSVTKPARNSIGSSSNCVSIKANVGRQMDHQPPKESFQPNKPVTSSIPTNKFNFRRDTSHQAKGHSITNLVTNTVSSTTNGASKMTTVGPQMVQEPELDPFDSSLTDDMLISLCAGLDSPHRQPSTVSDSKPVNSTTRTSATSVNMHQQNSTWQQTTSGARQSVSHKPAPSSSVAHPRPPISTQTASSQNVCSLSEIEKKRQQAMARRKKHGNGGQATAILTGAMATQSMLPPR